MSDLSPEGWCVPLARCLSSFSHHLVALEFGELFLCCFCCSWGCSLLSVLKMVGYLVVSFLTAIKQETGILGQAATLRPSLLSVA